MTQRQLDRLRRKWQKTLRLQDWKIKARVVGLGVIPDDDLGRCEWLLDARTADINILDPACCEDGDAIVSQDVEGTLVHELLHCHFAPFHSENQAINTQAEQVIDTLAEALVGLDRIKRPTRKTRSLKAASKRAR